MKLPDLNAALQLTTEQQFLIRSAEIESEHMPQPHLRALLLDLLRQVMVKDNVIRTMIREATK